MLIKKITLTRAITYVIAQLLGCVTGAALTRAQEPGLFDENDGCPTRLAPGVSWGSGFITEFLSTMMLMFVVCSSVDQGRAPKIPHLQVSNFPYSLNITIIILLHK